jgi:hypothetical protein
VASKKFAPPAPLLDAGEAVMLLALVPDVPAGAVKISAEFKE